MREQVFLNGEEKPNAGIDDAKGTRRQAFGMFVAAVATVSFASPAEAKKRGKRRKRKKRKNSGNSGGQPTGRAPHVALGAYVPRALDDQGELSAFSSAIGRQPDYLVWYEGWSQGAFGRNHRVTLNTIDASGLTPVIVWEPMDLNGPTIDQPAYRLANITRGAFDAYIDGWAEGLATYGKPVMLNFAHEMNGGWFPWGAGVNGNQPGDFIAAWRHVHGRFAARGASNVRWVWAPNVVYNGVPATLRDVYPGDAYVDWFGMNGYNWGTSVYWESCPCRSTWQSFPEIFDETYHQLVALANKPIMIGETASSEKGGNKARWITSTLLDQLPNSYPRIRAFSWFNSAATGLDTTSPGVVEPTAKVDWPITSSKAARKAFAAAAQDSYYQASLRSMT